MKQAFIILILCFQSTLYAQTDSATIKKVDELFDKYLDLLDSTPDSISFYIDSIEIVSRKEHYQKGIALALRERGLFYSDRGNYVKAMVFMDSALTIDEAIDYKDGIASDLLFIGVNFFDQGKTEAALDYLPRARSIYAEMEDFHGVALINSNLGSVYRNLDQFDKALEVYNASYEFYSQDGYESFRAGVENNIGNIYKDLKQYDLALEYLFKSKATKEEFNKESTLMSTLSNIGDIYQEQDRVEEAIEYYEQAMELANKHSAVLLQKDISLDLSRAYEKLGNETRALQFYKNYNQLKDSILSDDFNNDLANMKIKYDTDRKEKENLILVKDNELKEADIQKERSRKILFASLAGIIFLAALFIFIQFKNKKKLNLQLEKINSKVNSQNATLKVLNKELIDSEENLTASNQSKDQLISMLSHDLLNPITAITNYTNQVSEKAGDMTKQELSTSFKKVQNAVIPLQDLLDNILQWAQFQNQKLTPHSEPINIIEIIEKIIELYQPGAAFKGVKINTKLVDGITANTDRLMIYFIIRNILNNAVKFSSHNTTILIETETADKNIIITVKDEGKGFDANILTALNDEQQTDTLITTNGSGVGLSTSRQFIRLLKGSILFGNRKNTGAFVTITIPKV